MPYYIDSKREGKKIGRVYIDKAQIVHIGDETAYSFFSEMNMYPLASFVHKDDVDFFTNSVNTISTTEKKHMLIRLKCSDEYIWCYIIMSLSKKHSADGVLVMLDIFDVKYLADKIAEYEFVNKEYTAVLGMLADMTFEYDLSTKEFKIHSSSEEPNTYTSVTTLENWRDTVIDEGLVVEKDIPAFQKLISDIKRGTADFFYSLKGSITSDKKVVDNMHIKGTTIEYDMNFSKVVGTISSVSVAMSKDISFLTQINTLDPLTGLLNKRSITEYATKKTLDKTPENIFSLIMMDLDYFKDINDTYGHMFGDDVLTTVSTILKAAVGNRGKIGRVGGDEFLIVLDGVCGEEALRPILKSIRTHIQWAYAETASALKITTSMGISSFPKDAVDYETLFKVADKCLYIAKAKGRNRFIVYRPELHGSISDILSDDNTINVEKQRTAQEKTQNILDFMDKFSNCSFEDIPDALTWLMNYYDVDKASIYYGPERKLLYRIANYDVEDSATIPCLIESYIQKFNVNIFSIGNYDNIKGAFPQLYEYMENEKVRSMLQFLITDDDGAPYGVILFATHARYKKWSDSDIPYIATACKLLELALKRCNKKE